MGRDPNLESSVYVPRLVVEEREDESAPLGSYFDAAAIVVLGGPGAGKTALFERTAEEEGALALTVRRFLRLQLEELQGRTL